MMFRQIWRWVRIVYSLFFIFAVVVLVAVLGFLMFGILIDQKALVNAATVNSITLIMGLVSLPGIVVQLMTLLTINDRKQYIATTKCPNCRHTVDIRIVEE